MTQGAALPANSMIPITHLEQLNAIRYDLDGNGQVTANANDYAEAFPGVVSGRTYTGYELANNLNFRESTHYLKATNQQEWTPNDPVTPTNAGWAPIGTFTGTFDGGGNTISNLYINRTTSGARIGLFSYVRGTIQNVGLVSPNVTGGDDANVGGLVGESINSIISACYVSGGTITEGNGNGSQGVGGLVGYLNSSTMHACYVSRATIEGGDDAHVGGLIGIQTGRLSTCYVKGATIEGGDDANVGGLSGGLAFSAIYACYVSSITAEGGNSAAKVGSLTGNQNRSTITACYAGGKDYGISIVGSGTVTNSYNQIASGGTEVGPDKFETTLKNPTGYAGIYANWNIDIDNTDSDNNVNTGKDDPWDFGGTSDYPKLKADFDGNGTATVSEFGSQ